MAREPISGILKIGVIGAGRIGRIHTTNLIQRIEGVAVGAIADPKIDGAREWVDNLAIPHVYEDYQMILDDDEIDAVYVCSSTDTHARIVEEAATAGKHIFCEKPIDLDVGRVRSALDAVRAAGVALQIGVTRRFDHNFATVQDKVTAGEIGQGHLVKITSRDPEPPPAEYVRVSGGLFLDMTIHDFDMARFLAGSEVIAVSAAGVVLVDPSIGEAGDIDTAVVTLWFENGAIGVIDNSRQAVYGYDQRVEVFGSAGMVQAENDTSARVTRTGVEGSVSQKPLWFFLERYTQAFLSESEAFVAALREGTAPRVTGEDGLKPILIGLAAQKSLREARVVRVEEIE